MGNITNKNSHPGVVVSPAKSEVVLDILVEVLFVCNEELKYER